MLRVRAGLFYKGARPGPHRLDHDHIRVNVLFGDPSQSWMDPQVL